MSSINKQSVREEFESLQAQFEKLSSEGKMPEESRALFQTMLILFKVVMPYSWKEPLKRTIRIRIYRLRKLKKMKAQPKIKGPAVKGIVKMKNFLPIPGQ